MQREPLVDEVRPSICPWCNAASRPAGRSLVLIGHGLRDRQQRGPLAADAEPTLVVVRVRRFLCLACGGTPTVVPRGVAPRRHYSAAAIARAVALFGVVGESAAAVRAQVSPAQHIGFDESGGGWVTLRRWIRAARDGTLFARLPPAVGVSIRGIAEHLAAMLTAHAPPSAARLQLEHQAFLGGGNMA